MTILLVTCVLGSESVDNFAENEVAVVESNTSDESTGEGDEFEGAPEALWRWLMG